MPMLPGNAQANTGLAGRIRQNLDASLGGDVLSMQQLLLLADAVSSGVVDEMKANAELPGAGQLVFAQYAAADAVDDKMDATVLTPFTAGGSGGSPGPAVGGQVLIPANRRGALAVTIRIQVNTVAAQTLSLDLFLQTPQGAFIPITLADISVAANDEVVVVGVVVTGFVEPIIDNRNITGSFQANNGATGIAAPSLAGTLDADPGGADDPVTVQLRGKWSAAAAAAVVTEMTGVWYADGGGELA